MYRSPSNSQGDGRQDDKGFTLIEILIAIVLVGILSAVAVVGISNLVSKGSTSACTASRDSATAASAVYFAANSNTYPINFTQLTTAAGTPTIPAALTLPSGVAINTGTSGFRTQPGNRRQPAPRLHIRYQLVPDDDRAKRNHGSDFCVHLS